jgi:hypothetical protein
VAVCVGVEAFQRISEAQEEPDARRPRHSYRYQPHNAVDDSIGIEVTGPGSTLINSVVQGYGGAES